MEDAHDAVYIKYVIKEQDTLFDILRRFDTSVNDLIVHNKACDLFSLKAGQTIYIRKTPVKAGYVLSENESLLSVVKKFGISAAALLRANPHLFPQEIRPGTKIRLPDQTLF